MATLGLISFLIAISLSMMIIPILVRVAPSLGLVDEPGPRKVHQEVIPRVGGVAIYLGTIVPLLIWMPETHLLYALVAALTILFLFGLWDDKSNINFRYKFLGQITAAIVAVYWGGIEIHHFPFVEDYGLPSALTRIFTVVLLVGVTNAVNMADGLDGLAGGTSMLAIGCMSVVAYQASDANVVVFGLALMGAILGFLRFNTYPARIFMGDSGSQLLGFCAGLICILVTQQSNTALSPMMAILVLGLPLLDVFTVMAIRVSEGRSPFSADNNHIHHMFLGIGYSHREAVFIVYAIQIVLVLSAFLMRYASDILLLAVYVGFCLSLHLMIKFAKNRVGLTSEWVMSSQSLLVKIGVGEDLSAFRGIAYYLIRFSFSAILVLGVFCIEEIPRDFGYIAVLLLVLLLPTLLIKNEITNAIRRLCLYVTAGFIVYFMEVSQQDGGLIATYLPLLFVIIGIAVVFLIKSEGSSVREFSSLDFLLLALALIISIFPNAKVIDGVDATLIIEIVILFYAVDVLFNRRERLETFVLFGATISLVLMIVKGLF
jgi:UDP-GlcNAc:undecaprenyl-phosphate GlcNAc-1-phosphate transferase